MPEASNSYYIYCRRRDFSPRSKATEVIQELWDAAKRTGLVSGELNSNNHGFSIEGEIPEEFMILLQEKGARFAPHTKDGVWPCE